MNESTRLLSTPRVLDYLDASRRLRAQNDARELDLLARLALDPDPYGDGHPELDKEWIVEDVALALRMSSAAAAGMLELARHLIRRFPSTLAAMRAGRLDARHAQRLVDATLDLSDELSAEVERRVLPRVESQAPAQFAQSVRRQVAKLDPRSAEQKHTDALPDRRVAFTPVENGMTELWADPPLRPSLLSSPSSRS